MTVFARSATGKQRRRPSLILRITLLAVVGVGAIQSIYWFLIYNEEDYSAIQIPPAAATVTTSSHTASSPINLNRKNGTHVIINIGSNLDPIVPNPEDDPCTLAIAFEPIVGHLIPDHPALHVVPGAVSSTSGLSAMNIYNLDGRSSSLSKASYNARWNRNSKIKLVQTISLKEVLDALGNYEIDTILTDMQGHDFTGISSAGVALAEHNVKRLVTEVSNDNVASYLDSPNDFCLHWLPHMTSVGYEFEGLLRMLDMGYNEGFVEGYGNEAEANETCRKKLREDKNDEPKPGLNEFNALWRLKTEKKNSGGDFKDIVKMYHYGTHSSKKPGHKFSKEDYSKCT